VGDIEYDLSFENTIMHADVVKLKECKQNIDRGLMRSPPTASVCATAEVTAQSLASEACRPHAHAR
jgi:hypothetical protein